MLDKVMLIIGIIITIFTFGYKTGKRKEQEENYKESINQIKKANAIRKKIKNTSRSDKLKLVSKYTRKD